MCGFTGESVMPGWDIDNDPREATKRRKAAEKRVLQKYPAILVGSSGWHRALSNQLKKGR